MLLKRGLRVECRGCAKNKTCLQHSVVLGLPGVSQNVARAVLAAFAWGWVPGIANDMCLQHFVGLRVPGACQNAARAVFCSVCLGLGVGGVRKPFCVAAFCWNGCAQGMPRCSQGCDLQHLLGFGCQG